MTGWGNRTIAPCRRAAPMNAEQQGLIDSHLPLVEDLVRGISTSFPRLL